VLHLLTVLRRRGLADQPLPKPFAKELGDFRDYQREVRGVADETWQIRERHLTIVLSALMPGGRFDLKKLAPKAINALVLRTIDEGHRTTAGNLCTTTRAFFQYLRATGHRDVPGDAGIFAPKKRRRWPSAKALTVEQLRLLLLPLRADTAMAARDFAVLAVLARTGLRRVDLSRLTLDDFDGRAGTLTVRRNKSRVGHVVPLTPDARAALLTYVAKYRRESPCRALFLSESYPFHEGLTARGVAAITERAFARAGIQHVSRGAHVFRHTLVTHLVAQRAPPKAIADLIIHTSIETTALYTRIDLQRLKDVARQWSHGASASAGIERSQS
jgi:site-specific recombinase XerD